MARDVLGTLAHLRRNLHHESYDYGRALHDLRKAQKILSEIEMDKIAIENGERGLKYSEKWWLDSEKVLVQCQVNVVLRVRPHGQNVLLGETS